MGEVKRLEKFTFIFEVIEKHIQYLKEELKCAIRSFDEEETLAWGIEHKNDFNRLIRLHEEEEEVFLRLELYLDKYTGDEIGRIMIANLESCSPFRVAIEDLDQEIVTIFSLNVKYLNSDLLTWLLWSQQGHARWLQDLLASS